MPIKRIISIAMSVCLMSSAFVALTGSTVPAAQGACGPIRYAIYIDANFGTGRTMCANESNLANQSYGPLPWQNYNNSITSVKNNFAASSPVGFYDGTNYVTFLKTYATGTTSSNVGATLNDRFSSAWNGNSCCN